MPDNIIVIVVAVAWALTTAHNVASLVSPTTVVHGHSRPHWFSLMHLAVQNAGHRHERSMRRQTRAAHCVHGSGFVGT